MYIVSQMEVSSYQRNTIISANNCTILVKIGPQSCRGVNLTSHRHLLLRLRMPCVFMASYLV